MFPKVKIDNEEVIRMTDAKLNGMVEEGKQVAQLAGEVKQTVLSKWINQILQQ